MKEQFKTWGWYKTYQISEFHYNKITLEDSFPKDKPDDECIDELEERIDRQARRKYPHLFEGVESAWQQSISGYDMTPKYNGSGVFNHKQSSIPEETRIGDIVNDIKSCKDLTVLSSYKLIAKTKPEFQEAYDEMLNKLSTKSAT